MKKEIEAYLDQQAAVFSDLSDKIHGFAELAGEEHRSQKVLCDLLEQAGFSVERGLGSQPTAFRAAYGSGGVCVGFLAEYDALPGLNQPPEPYYCGDSSRSGHGCGHNLLGAGSAAAAIALKQCLETHHIPGRVVIYGTPAEETLYGKNQLIADGYFHDVQAVLSWHPGVENHCGEFCHKAMHSLELEFRGTTAHASVCPHLGRSALDACELTNVGVNYLREHVPTDVRMHYSYVDLQGKPNVVPGYAKLWYFIRARRRSTADEVLERVLDVARGAALMTGTAFSHKILASGSETVINCALSRLAYQNMTAIGPPVFDREDMDFARRLAAESGVGSITGRLSSAIREPEGKEIEEFGSTDFSDVSQLVPALELNTACYAEGTPGHHWTVTAAAKTPIAHKGMLFAAKVLACTALDLILSEETLRQVQAEFASRKSGLAGRH